MEENFWDTFDRSKLGTKVGRQRRCDVCGELSYSVMVVYKGMKVCDVCTAYLPEGWEED